MTLELDAPPRADASYGLGFDRVAQHDTLAGYRAIARSQLLPAFGDMPLESITTPIGLRWTHEVVAIQEPLLARSLQGEGTRPGEPA